MQTQETKLTYGIKGKLISAVAMLLVAIIMVVSSTYAWFTLSTAPEVTGISTAVGANGALEMLLLTKDETKNDWLYNDGVVQTGVNVNTYWGNLVDVSGKYGDYGLSQISLYPSALNIDGDKLEASYLKNPVYGADGRVSGLEDSSVTGTYSGNSFKPDDQYGVRAVGTSSGMTARQLAYRNAVSSASSNLAKARNASANTLENYGGTVGDIAVKKALNGESAEFTAAEIASLKALATDLSTKVIPVIEESYKQYIIAFAASKAVDGAGEAAENAHSVVSGYFESGDTIYTILGKIDTQFNTTLSGSALNTYIDKLEATKASVDAALKGVTEGAGAYAGLNSLDTSDPNAKFTWTQISQPLNNLVKVDAIVVCGMTVDEIRAEGGLDRFVSVAMDYQMNKGGILVQMGTGAGVYADVADHCGDYNAGIVLHDLKYGNMNLGDVNARMATKTSVTPNSYLVQIDTLVTNEPNGAPSKAAGNDMPISEFYGYIIDLAFRTNAAESNLLLQTAPKDRIYSDNAEGGETWGKGSTMTFAAVTNDFTNAQVKALMSSIKVVFFNTDDRTVLAYAKLDMENATTGADGITANLYLYKTVSATKLEGATYKVGADGAETTGVVYVAADGTCYAADLCTEVILVSEGAYAEANATNVDIFLKEGDAVIQALTQNQIAHVSALVYLDGANVTNKDVAATVGQSMTGSMNLQFASSATLVPMDYAGFQNNTSGTENNG